MILVPHSRSSIESHKFEQPAIVICIAYPTGRLHRVFGERVLHMRFSDCLEDGTWCFPDNKGSDVAVPMTRGQAIDIVDFVEKHRGDVGEIHAACYGGISRSTGVLDGLAEIYDWESDHLYAMVRHPDGSCSQRQPNPHVRGMIVKVGRDIRA